MTAYEKQHVQDKTDEEFQAGHTNYFGSTYADENSLDSVLSEHFQNAD